MTMLLLALGFGFCLLCSALYSGSELGFYSLSRVQVDLDARRGLRSARQARWLLRDDAALLITILIGNNLALEVATLLADEAFSELLSSPTQVALLTTAVLSPLVFLFGEALPKELFRRRPHGLLPLATPLVAGSRVVFWPLERLLRGLSWALERSLGVRPGPGRRAAGRDSVLSYLAEGQRMGALSQRAAALAHNTLALRTIPITQAMVPWERVHCLEAEESDQELRESVRRARHSRLPVVSVQGGVLGYVHQLDVLVADSSVSVLDSLRDLPFVPASCSVAQALSSLRVSGKRAAVVGDSLGPLGLVTLKDLVEEISGDLAGL